MIHQAVVTTADLNLASVCLSVGIPPAQPAFEMLESDSGKSRGRWILTQDSNCGKYAVGKVFEVWANHTKAKGHYRDIVTLSNFVRGRSEEVHGFDTWLNYACNFIRANHGEAPRPDEQSAKAYVEKYPDRWESCVLSFPFNNRMLYRAAKAAKENPRIHSTQFGGHTTWSAGMSRKKKEEFFSQFT